MTRAIAKEEDLGELVKKMQAAHAQELKKLQRQVLHERLQGIVAQIELGQLLKERTERELKELE